MLNLWFHVMISAKEVHGIVLTIRFCVNLHKHKSESGWLTNLLGPFCPPDAGRAKKNASLILLTPTARRLSETSPQLTSNIRCRRNYFLFSALSFRIDLTSNALCLPSENGRVDGLLWDGAVMSTTPSPLIQRLRRCGRRGAWLDMYCGFGGSIV